MIDPMRCIYLNNRWYNYISDSPTKNVGLKNTANETQNSRTFSVQGGTQATFTLTIDLSDSYEIRLGSSTIGTTSWRGISRLVDMENYICAAGNSMPLVFVTPWGVTYNVVPIGSLDISMFNPDNPNSDGCEFRVSLTLATT